MTNKLSQIILIDWLEFTLFNERVYESNYLNDDNELVEKCKTVNLGKTPEFYFLRLFKVRSSDLVHELKGVNGYNETWSYGNIKIMINSERSDMGIHFILSGQACREFEDLGLDWYEFIDYLFKFEANINRVDIAIDDFTNKYFTIDLLYNLVLSGRVVSKFRSTYYQHKIELVDSKSLGNSLTFGSRASMLEIQFYDKLLERKKANYKVSDDIKYWYRCECRFRSDRAYQVLSLLRERTGLNELIKGVLGEYIRFVIPGKDQNKSRWKTCKFWNKYLENIGNISLVSRSPEWSITRKKNWLKKSVSRSQFTVFLSNLDNLSLDIMSSDFIYEMLKEGFERIDEKDLNRINQFRISNKMEPISYGALLTYVNSIREVLLVTDNQFIDE